MDSKKTICAVDLFCGIGGLTHGLIKAGIAVKAGVDNDSSCRVAYERNNPGAKFLSADIAKILPQTINKFYKGADVKVLVGCAPCQPFSFYKNKQRKVEGTEKNSNFGLLKHILRLVEACDPDVVSVENVPGLQKECIFSDFSKKIRKMGYVGEPKVVFCPEYGVPQTRKRLVYLASKYGEIAMIPPYYPDKNQWPTVNRFIKGLPKLAHGGQSRKDRYHACLPLTDRNLKRIRQSEAGRDWRDWDKNLVSPCHKKAKYFSAYGRMKGDGLAPTITTQFCYYSTGRFGHPKQDRAISLREGALLQTFPKTYQFDDDMQPMMTRRIARHIGNAVPVELGRAIGMSIGRHVNEQ